MKTLKNIVFACISIGFICSNSNLLASTYYVSTSDNNTSGDGSLSSPWRTVYYGVGQLQAGDNLIIRGGHYRESKINNFSSGTSASPITIKSYPGEQAVLSAMTDASGTGNWQQVSGNIYRLSGGVAGYTVHHVSQAGIPLKLMVSYDNYSGSYSDLTAEGQWSRNSTSGDIWVWAKGGGNPGNYDTEYAVVDRLMHIEEDVSYINCENITFEGGYYPIYVEGDYCTFKNCTFRNCFGDAFKVGDSCNRSPYWNSEYGEVLNCDMYYFGENGIDITGGDYWLVKNTSIHDGVKNRYYGGKLNGIILKNCNIGSIVEGCRIYNIDSLYGAITLGGDSYYDNVPAAEDIIVRNNIIHDVIGNRYIVLFMGSENCSFINNIVYNCSALDAVVSLYDSVSHGGIHYQCSDNLIANNIFYNNSMSYNYKEADNGNDSGLVIDNNILPLRASWFDNQEISYQNLASSKGYDINSFTGTPGFVNYSFDLMRLDSGSIGVDDGMSLDEVFNDYNEAYRFFGNGLDIGAFENCYDESYEIISNGTLTSGWTFPSGYDLSISDDNGLNSNVLAFNDKGICSIEVNNLVKGNISFKIKASGVHAVAVQLKTAAGTTKTVKYYSSYTATNFSDPNFLRFPLGTGSASTEDGEWHMYAFDLEDALQQALSTDQFDYITRIYVENASSSSAVYVDDIELHETLEGAEAPRGCISDGTNISIASWTLPSGYDLSVAADTELSSNVLAFNDNGICSIAVNNLRKADITLKIKASGGYAVAVQLKTAAGATKTIKYYSSYTTTNFSDPNFLRFPLGAGSASTEDGEWHIYTFDLEAALKEALATDGFAYVTRIYVENSSTSETLYVDDIELHYTYMNARMPKGCISEWKFNEGYGTKVEDSGAPNHKRTATLTNMSVSDPHTSDWVMGRKNKALRFGAGTNTYVTAPALTTSFLEGLTFSAWVKYDNINETKTIAAALTGYHYVYPRIYQDDSGIRLQVRMDGDNLVQVFSSQNKISVGEWTHIAAVVDVKNKKAKVYINGNEEGSTTFTYSTIDTGAYPLYIGNDTSGQSFSGCIDEVKLYNRALTKEEIAILAE